MKDLPKVYAVSIDKTIDSVQTVFYGDRNNRGSSTSLSQEDVADKINRMFNAYDYVYKCEVEITTNKGSEKKTLIGKTNSSVLTIDNEVIYFRDIKDIRKI